MSVKVGDNVPIYLSYDDISVAEVDAYVRIFHVDKLAVVDKSTVDKVKVMGDEIKLVDIPDVPGVRIKCKSAEARWDREATGYGSVISPQIKIDVGEPTGLYAAQISDTLDFIKVRTAYFIVRPSRPTPGTKILFCWPWTTTVAYADPEATNNAGAFSSLYDSDQPTRGRRVSVERPLEKFAFMTDKRYYTHLLPLKLWKFLIDAKLTDAEVQVDPCTSFDLHAEPDILKGYNLFISVGHDEYWSSEMRDRVEDFVRAGGNAAFFSANTAWWRIKLDELNVMTCKKSAMEDSRAGFDGDATSNWAGSPTDRPENTLTGVSFRRGSMEKFDNPYVVVGDIYHEPLLEGLKAGSTIPSSGESMFKLETDAADYKQDGDSYSTTGLDGTPKNFRILAVAEFFNKGQKVGRKMATMGYFTNVGTVFTAATTDWADWLHDKAVRQVTKNVVSLLSKRIPRPAMTLLKPPPRPGLSWSEMRGASDDALDDALAICTLYQGDLLLQNAEKKIRRTDAEYPSSEWEETDIDSVERLVSFGTNLYGKYLFAISVSDDFPKNSSLFYQKIVDAEGGRWKTASDQPTGTLTAIAAPARDTFFVVLNNARHQMLYSTSVTTDGDGKDHWAWTLLGKLGLVLKTMTGWDTKLFALGDDGYVYCRESSDIDLVWTRIAPGPEEQQQLSLSAYFGRLMVLVANNGSRKRKIVWRTATSTFGSIEPFLLFSRPVGDSIEYSLGPLPGSGGFWTTGGGLLSTFVATHMTYVQPATALFYNHVDQSGAVVRFSVDGGSTVIRPYGRSFDEWTHIVSVPGIPLPSVLFYSASSGKGVVGTFDDAGDFHKKWSTDKFRQGWTSIASTWYRNILFYDSVYGHAEWGILGEDGSFESQPPFTDFSKGWDQIVPAGNHYLFFYNETTGAGALGELDNGFKTVWENGFSTGWVVA
ncbi:MAG: N,N-dimethylformamidase beta subunit family domain-containing protein, partial [Nitrososphaeraceae archaeon]